MRPYLSYGDAIEVEVVGNGIAKDSRGPFTAYCIRVRRYTAGGFQEWFVYKRYSQFRDLKYYLRLHKAIEVPCEFPGKRVWNIFEREFLSQRQAALGQWMSSMLRCRRLPGAGATPEPPPSPALVARAASMTRRPCEMLAYRQVIQFLCEDTEVPPEYSGGIPSSRSAGGGAGAGAAEGKSDDGSASGAARASAAGAASSAQPAPALPSSAAAALPSAGGAGSGPRTGPRVAGPRSRGPPQASSRGSGAAAGGSGSRGPPLPKRKSKRPAIGVESFDYLKVVGKGAFGKVLVVRKKDTGKVYAMKVLEKQSIIKRKQVAHTQTERRVLGFTRHSFIVGLHFAF